MVTIRNILSINNINIDWVTAYVGYCKDLISMDEIKKLASEGKLGEVNEQQLINLYVEDSLKETFLQALKQIVESYSKKSIKPFDELLIEANKIWQIAFLIDIVNSSKPINEKLVDVSVLWSNLHYPEDWKEFIYYMPHRSGKIGSNEIVYKNLLSYIKSEKRKLGIKK